MNQNPYQEIALTLKATNFELFQKIESNAADPEVYQAVMAWVRASELIGFKYKMLVEQVKILSA
ncbi:hypothetical protein [Leptolyngbya sp. AN10]|uniref:hypothetical protein n=1 Tax=Leptolyngbya sp. AN10 TaxID=3423365 RepID=UPI003D321F01